MITDGTHDDYGDRLHDESPQHEEVGYADHMIEADLTQVDGPLLGFIGWTLVRVYRKVSSNCN